MILIITLYLVHWLDTQKQRRRFVKNLFIFSIVSLDINSGVINFTILVASSMLITIIPAVWLPMSRSKENLFLKFAFSTVVLAPPHQAPGRQGSWIFTNCTPFIDKCYMPALVEIGSVIQEKELKVTIDERSTTFDEWIQTKTGSNRSPQWLR